MWLRIRYVSACLQQGTDPWGFYQTFGNCWLAGQMSVSLKWLFFFTWSFSDIGCDWHDYVPIFRAAGTKYVTSKVKGEKSKALENSVFCGRCLLRH